MGKKGICEICGSKLNIAGQATLNQCLECAIKNSKAKNMTMCDETHARDYMESKKVIENDS